MRTLFFWHQLPLWLSIICKEVPLNLCEFGGTGLGDADVLKDLAIIARHYARISLAVAGSRLCRGELCRGCKSEGST